MNKAKDHTSKPENPGNSSKSQSLAKFLRRCCSPEPLAAGRLETVSGSIVDSNGRPLGPSHLDRLKTTTKKLANTESLKVSNLLLGG